MIRVYAHANGATRPADRLNPAWLKPATGVLVWVDLSNPTEDEGRILSDVFHFHEHRGDAAVFPSPRMDLEIEEDLNAVAQPFRAARDRDRSTCHEQV